jgi:hypothetical protein
LNRAAVGEISDETGVKLLMVDRDLQERKAWLSGRALVPTREGTVQRILGCGCDVGAIGAGLVLWAAKPLVILSAIIAFFALLQFGFIAACVLSVLCGLGAFGVLFLFGFFLGFPIGVIFGLLGWEDVGWN